MIKIEDSEKIEDHVIKETKESFFMKVENMVWEKDVTYLEAVQLIVENESIDPTTISKLISKDLFARLEQEAEKLSLLKNKNTKTNRLVFV
jgi:hypothetical protein